jgi:Fe-S-cluster containining protein
MAVAGSGSLGKRVDGAVEILSDGFPGDPATGRLSIDESKLDSFFELHAGLPCPVLDPASGRCELYEWRPVSCRTYGPPVLFGREKSPPCRLCFAGAPEEEIERCRIEPDRDDLEETILVRLGVVAGEDWETLIPFALARLYTVSFAETPTDLEDI